MKLKNILYLVPALLLASCDLVEFTNYEEITPGTIKTDITSVESGMDGVSKTVALESVTAWTASKVGEDTDWFSVSPESGSGNASVTITVNAFSPRDLAREAIVLFTSDDGSQAGVAVKQAWAEPKTSFVFHKVESVVSGRSYLIVADGLGLAATPLSGSYGYLYDPQSILDVDGTVNLTSKTCAWTFQAIEGGFAIIAADGRYMYQKGTYNSFNVSNGMSDADGQYAWTVTPQGDGTVKIFNVGVEKYMQYSVGYSSWGSYGGPQENAVMPVLYEEEVDPNAAILIAETDAIEVAATDKTASFAITSGSAWVVDCDADWIESCTEGGNGDGEVVLSFGENKDFDADRVATVTVSGSGLTAVVTLTQKALVPSLSVDPLQISLAHSETYATINVTANVPWTVSGPEGVYVVPDKGEGDAVVELFMPSNRTANDIVRKFVVATESERVQTKSYEVVLTQKTGLAYSLPYTESFAQDLGAFSVENVLLPEGASTIWAHSGNANYGAKASAYINKTRKESESWLVSPNLDLSSVSSATVSYTICASNGVTGQYDEYCYGLVIEGDKTTKVDLGFGASYSGGYKWFNGTADLSAWAGKTVKFAFVYKSNSSNCATVEVKNFAVEPYATFKSILARGAGKYDGRAYVVAVGSTNTVLYDGTGYMFAYEKAKASKVGDYVNLSGNVTVYNGCLEWNNPAISVQSQGNEIKHPEPVVIDAAEFVAYQAAPSVKYAKVKGTKSGYYVTAEGVKVNVYSNENIPNANVEVLGYTIGYYSKNACINFVVSSWSEASDEPEEEVFYTLTPTAGSNNGYANNCDIEIGGITWNLTGNSTTDPWRIGGKSLNAVDRELYSKTVIADDVCKIVATHGTSSLTVNSVKLTVSKNADFSSPVDVLDGGAFAASAEMTFERPAGHSWAGCYYKITYNVTVEGSSNKFLQFVKGEFYK